MTGVVALPVEGRSYLEKWSTFATVAGGAAAGLTGLLFVAVSIRIGVIAKSQELRNRAAQTLALFVTPLFIAILLSIPDQSLRVLGIELVALAVITGVGMQVLDRRARVDPSTHGASTYAVASILDAVAPNALTSILLLIAGVLLVFGVHAGLYVLVLPVLVALAGGVTSAWLLLTKIPQ
jgi:MFS-type transporter involved in bile tolerance (Atg22 family)